MGAREMLKPVGVAAVSDRERNVGSSASQGFLRFLRAGVVQEKGCNSKSRKSNSKNKKPTTAKEYIVSSYNFSFAGESVRQDERSRPCELQLTGDWNLCGTVVTGMF